MNEFPKNIRVDLQAAREVVKKIKSIDMQITTIEELIDLLAPLFNGYMLKTKVFHPSSNAVIYRTSVNYQAEFVHELTYPPSKFTPLGRANRAGVPMFYGALNADTAISELNPKVGDLFTLSKWVFTKKYILNHVGYVDNVLRKIGSKRSEKELTDLAPLDKPSTYIANFLAGAFTQRITENERYKYKLTVAITDHLLAPLESEHDLDFAGIFYPTVANFAQVDNVALKPSFVDKGLQVLEAYCFEVDSIEISGTGRKNFTLFKRNVANTFRHDGKINWQLYNPPNTIQITRP